MFRFRFGFFYPKNPQTLQKQKGFYRLNLS